MNDQRGSAQKKKSSSERTLPTGRRLGETNRLVAWASIVAGAATGLVMGLWSFDGPAPVPQWIGDYETTARRLIRLGHIAFFGLGILNLALARELPRLSLKEWLARTAARCMNFGNVFLPITLFAAGVYQPLKYLLPFPAVSVFVALAIVAYGVSTQRE